MPTYTADPITGILIPIVGSDPGPDYASHVSDALTKLAHLTHTGASNLDGYQIPAAGLNVNADVSIQSNNLTALRSIRYTSQASTLAGSGDIDCVYVSGNNLFYNNGSGTPVQLTSGNSLNVTTSNNFSITTTTTNLTINPAATTIFVACDTSGGSLIVTLPLANAVPTGRFYIVKDAVGVADTDPITINPAGSDTLDGASGYTLNAPLNSVMFVSNGTNRWHVLFYDKTVYQSGETLSFQDADLFMDSDSAANMSGIVTFQGRIGLDGYVLSTGSYTVPTVNSKTVILCIPSAGALTVNLPPAPSVITGAIIIVKDAWGTAGTNNITINPDGTDNIEGLNAPKIIQANWGCVTLCAAKAFANNYWVLL